MSNKAGPVLVCGAAGFLGRHCVRELVRVGVNVLGAGHASASSIDHVIGGLPFVEGELSDRSFVEALIDRAEPRSILFVAGPANVQRSFVDPERDFMEQMAPLLTLLGALRRFPEPPAMLLVSSAAVYGNARTSPVPEDTPLEPMSPYGFHKVAQERLLREYQQMYRVPYSVARVFSTYGPGLRRLAVWDIAKRALEGDFSLRGTGDETRDYLHVDDVGRAIVRIIQQTSFVGEVFNVASGEETTIAQLAGLIYRQLGVDAAPEFDGASLPGSPLRWRADVSRLASIGFVRQVGLSQGLEATIDWIRRHA